MPSLDLEKLKNAGHKITKPRLAVWKVLRAAQAPLSAQIVWQKIRGQGVDLVSVYRTLRLLRDLDLAQEESIGNEAMYCLGGGQYHHHIICDSCGKTAAIPCQHNFKQVKNFKITSHTLTLAGLCAACSNQSN